MVTARAAMLKTVRCQGFRARKVLKVVWLHAATTAISVALGPSRITSEAKFAAKASDIVSGWALSGAGIGTDTLKTEVRTASTSSAPNVRRAREVQPGERGGGQPGTGGHDGQHVDSGDEGERLHQARESARRDAKALVQGIGTRRAGEKSRVGRRCTPRRRLFARLPSRRCYSG